MKNILIRSSASDYLEICKIIKNELNYQDLYFNESNKSIISKVKILKILLKDIYSIILNLKKINNSNSIICIGYVNLFLILLKKLHILKVKNIFWLGFFIHNPKLYSVFKLYFKLFISKNVKFIVFSKYEKILYTNKMGLNSMDILYLPYGDWDNENVLNFDNNYSDDYYFSGGYSNRDYISLINTFNKVNLKLVIVASKLNSEIDNIIVNNNITIYKDIESDHFQELLKNSKACILPFKHNSGAAGQSVVLRCMRMKKIIIATETDVIKEYIDNNDSGIIIKSIDKELIDVLYKIENNMTEHSKLGENAQKKFMNEFSYYSISTALKEMFLNN